MESCDESSKPRKSTLSCGSSGLLVGGAVVAVKGEQRKHEVHALISNTNENSKCYFTIITFWGQTVVRPVGRVWKPVAGDNGRKAKNRAFRDAGEIGIGAVHVEESKSFRVASSPFKIVH